MVDGIRPRKVGSKKVRGKKIRPKARLRLARTVLRLRKLELKRPNNLVLEGFVAFERFLIKNDLNI
jgi:hypothetical protein